MIASDDGLASPMQVQSRRRRVGALLISTEVSDVSQARGRFHDGCQRPRMPTSTLERGKGSSDTELLSEILGCTSLAMTVDS